MQRHKQTLGLLKKQKAEVLDEIKKVTDADPQLKETIRKICTIPGVGLMTAAAVIGETDGFSLVKNKRQLISYASYDVINQESGTSVKKSTHFKTRK